MVEEAAGGLRLLRVEDAANTVGIVEEDQLKTCDMIGEFCKSLLMFVGREV